MCYYGTVFNTGDVPFLGLCHLVYAVQSEVTQHGLLTVKLVNCNAYSFIKSLFKLFDLDVKQTNTELLLVKMEMFIDFFLDFNICGEHALI